MIFALECVEDADSNGIFSLLSDYVFIVLLVNL